MKTTVELAPHASATRTPKAARVECTAARAIQWAKQQRPDLVMAVYTFGGYRSRKKITITARALGKRASPATVPLEACWCEVTVDLDTLAPELRELGRLLLDGRPLELETGFTKLQLMGGTAPDEPHTAILSWPRIQEAEDGPAYLERVARLLALGKALYWEAAHGFMKWHQARRHLDDVAAWRADWTMAQALARAPLNPDL